MWTQPIPSSSRTATAASESRLQAAPLQAGNSRSTLNAKVAGKRSGKSRGSTSAKLVERDDRTGKSSGKARFATFARALRTTVKATLNGRRGKDDAEAPKFLNLPTPDREPRDDRKQPAEPVTTSVPVLVPTTPSSGIAYALHIRLLLHSPDDSPTRIASTVPQSAPVSPPENTPKRTERFVPIVSSHSRKKLIHQSRKQRFFQPATPRRQRAHNLLNHNLSNASPARSPTSLWTGLDKSPELLLLFESATSSSPPSAAEDSEATPSPTSSLFPIESGAANGGNLSIAETSSIRGSPVSVLEWLEVPETLPLFSHRRRAVPLGPPSVAGHRRALSQSITISPEYPFVNDLFARKPLRARRGDDDVFRESPADRRDVNDDSLSGPYLKSSFKIEEYLSSSKADRRPLHSITARRSPWCLARSNDGEEHSDEDDSDIDPDLSATRKLIFFAERDNFITLRSPRARGLASTVRGADSPQTSDQPRQGFLV